MISDYPRSRAGNTIAYFWTLVRCSRSRSSIKCELENCSKLIFSCSRRLGRWWRAPSSIGDRECATVIFVRLWTRNAWHYSQGWPTWRRRDFLSPLSRRCDCSDFTMQNRVGKMRYARVHLREISLDISPFTDKNYKNTKTMIGLTIVETPLKYYYHNNIIFLYSCSIFSGRPPPCNEIL